MNQYDYIDQGFRVFGLHGVDANGVCGCGNQECKALFKHPRINNWQKVQHWSDEQLECMEEMGAFSTGFGVLCDGYLIVDVDPRNGGDVSTLGIDITQTFTVQTGGGGLHVYYQAPPGVSFVQHLDAHKGIDFKTTGYVVGCGSVHASGSVYELLHGSIDAIQHAPESLINMLRRPEFFRTQSNGCAIDVTIDDIKTMLNNVNPDATYDEWIRTGMAIHDATAGSGFDIWDDWSRHGKKYHGSSELEKHWHSFGKSANPAGIGTLIYYAELGGWRASVEFEHTLEIDNDLDDLSDIDLNAPPGFVGDLTRWINSQCRYPLEKMAAATAIHAVGCVGGLRYIDGHDNMTSNLFTFCVGGSAVGKEAVQQAFFDIMRVTGLASCTHGTIKSEQEMVRNLIRHQAALYMIDELGTVLRKIQNAAKGGASYLEGVIGLAMSVYSKANGFLPLGGDLKDDTRKALSCELSAARKALDDSGKGAQRVEKLELALDKIDLGLDSPFLSLLGYTTPITFDSLIDFEQATNGFIARAIVCQELDTNPKIKKGFKKQPMAMPLQCTLAALSSDSATKVSIPTENAAIELLDAVNDYFWQMAENEKGRSGLESIPRRGYEICAKVSFILSIPGGVRTVEHVRWAFALAKRDIDTKIKLAYANMSEKESPADALAVKIQKYISRDHGETLAVLQNRCRPASKADVQRIVALMIERGFIVEREEDGNQRKTLKLYIK